MGSSAIRQSIKAARRGHIRGQIPEKILSRQAKAVAKMLVNMESVHPLPLTPPMGYPVPSRPHAVSVQLPTWDDIKEMFTGAARVKDAQQTGYPRSFIHEDVKRLNQVCIDKFAPASSTCYLFSHFTHAKRCLDFAVSTEIHKDEAMPRHLLSLRAIDIELEGKDESSPREVITCYGIFCPADQVTHLQTYWRLVGVGISSRLAEYCMARLVTLTDVTGRPVEEDHLVTPSRWSELPHRKLSQRIASLLERATCATHRRETVARDDVYLYQTGMAAIYHAHQLLNQWRGTQSVVFGFPYELTLKLVETWSPSTKFYPFGDDNDMKLFEKYLEAESKEGRYIQAVWCECASNPLLKTSDLQKLRQLANKYGFAIVVDDTIGGFANIDMLGVADIIVTSLTKSFSGFADVMGGSVVLNSSMPFYSTLKTRLDGSYINTMFRDDAAQLEENSRDLLHRTSKLNATSSYLVRSLQPLVNDPSSVVTNIYYPEIDPATSNYRAHLRRETDDFTPGFGGLFTLQFEDVQLASIFFNALNVHKGPSLGASVTLSQPYVQTVFHKQKEWAGQCGLHESIVRVSVGLEDKRALFAAFRVALAEADQAKAARGMEGLEEWKDSSGSSQLTDIDSLTDVAFEK